MKIQMFHVDAFTSTVFHGNPAAVCPLSEWIPDATLQAIAAENNLSETAFFTGKRGRYRIRWFTPTIEVDLCGHATLASAFVIFHRLESDLSEAIFESSSGVLRVVKDESRIALDFPSRPPASVAPDTAINEALGAAPRYIGAARDILAVFDDEEMVRAMKPDMNRLRVLGRPVIVTARGHDCDFVSRFFAPTYGIDEDPVTGSAHCTLIPYWAHRIGKSLLTARQVSARGGELFCEDRGERVLIGGKAICFMEGVIDVSSMETTQRQERSTVTPSVKRPLFDGSFRLVSARF